MAMTEPDDGRVTLTGYGALLPVLEPYVDRHVPHVSQWRIPAWVWWAICEDARWKRPANDWSECVLVAAKRLMALPAETRAALEHAATLGGKSAVVALYRSLMEGP